MNHVFEVVDKSGRDICLTRKQWVHITTVHAEMTNYLDDIQKNLKNPLKIIPQEIGELYRYYIYLKHRNLPEKYLRLIVKYLNGDGFVITAHFVKDIK